MLAKFGLVANQKSDIYTIHVMKTYSGFNFVISFSSESHSVLFDGTS